MTHKKMTFSQIKQALDEREVTFTDIASALEKSVSHVTNVAKGITTSKSVALKISLALDKPHNHVFGDKYTKEQRRGPKDRSDRAKVVINALRANQPVPAPSVS